MHFFELLEQQLNSDAEIHKSIRLAKNVFTLLELDISHKEEIILSWFLETYLNTDDDADREDIINGFITCISSDYLKSLPSSAIRPQIKTKIISDLKKVLKSEKNNSKLIDTLLEFLKSSLFSNHFKKHPKTFVEILSELSSLCLTENQCTELINLILEIFNSHSSREKFLSTFLEKGFSSLLSHLKMGETVQLKLINLLQVLFFKKSHFGKFENLLRRIFFGDDADNPTELAENLIVQLHGIYESDFEDDIKIHAFSTIFQAFARSCPEDNNVLILQWFILLCHIIGVEVLVADKLLINRERIQKFLQNEAGKVSEVSYSILISLMTSLTGYSFDLTQSVNDISYLQWFQALVLDLAKNSKVNENSLKVLGACAELSPGIVESTLSDIISSLLSKSKKKLTDAFQLEYDRFINNLLRIFSKLQRTQKFLSKLLLSIKNTKSKLSIENILPESFREEFTEVVMMLPSLQSLSIMEYFLQLLDDDCVKVLEENSENVPNIMFLQAVIELLTAFLLGVKVLSHSTPQSILESFVKNMNKLKMILGRFGNALLARTHDRNLVRPFLKICFYWGEIETLIAFYSPEHFEELVTRDIAPTDLSILHSYLDGGQWSVLAERISNFGAGDCNQLFLKLVLQKLRVSKLRKNQSVQNVEATSKYILIQLTSELYRHNIVNELTPEDVCLVIDYLSQPQRKLLIEKLLIHLNDHEDQSKLENWIKDPFLQENLQFVTIAFSIILNKITNSFKILNESNGSSIALNSLTSCEFFNEDNEVIQDEIIKLSGNIKEILEERQKIGKLLKKKIEELKLKEHVDVLKILPLQYVPNDVRPLALVFATCLAIVSSKDKIVFQDLLTIMYKILNVKGEVCNWIDVGLCVKWLVELDDWKEETRLVRYKIIEILIKSASTMKSLDEIGSLVKMLKKRKIEDENCLLEAEVLVYQDLGKNVVLKKPKSLKDENHAVGHYRRAIVKSLNKRLETINGTSSGIDPNILLKAYSLILTRAVNQKNEEDINNIFQLNFNSYFDSAISELEKNGGGDGCIAFLSSVISSLPVIRERVPEGTVKRIWSAFKFRKNVDWRIFCKSLKDEEFEWIAKDLLQSTSDSLTHAGSNSCYLQVSLTTWQCFFEEKKEIIYENLQSLFLKIQVVLPRISQFTHDDVVHLLKFLNFCAGKSDVPMTSFMIDSMFDFVIELMYINSKNHQHFHDVFTSSVDVVVSLILTRYSWIQDKIQNIFQIFVLFLDGLSKRSDASLGLNDNDVSLMVHCGFYLERFSKIFVDKCEKDVIRVAPYFIAEVISSFVTVTTYPVVKAHLTNCVNNFLSISDSHGITYLLRVLSPAGQQVFQKIYDHYKKYYKFTGKV